ncbi:MAG TPA: hypothetical protein VL443_24395 [Cyclobacteriaceae bacterium]|nr:hypothetical protein [Cyclobacteriaceae bacterium]
MNKNPNSKFTPLGGANQDDSLITPSPDAAGRSLFENGDYRYALNLRIGSSRGSNFGDGENIKSTLALENYIGYDRQTWENSPTNFPGSLSGWSVYNSGTDLAFTYGSTPPNIFPGAKVSINLSTIKQTVTLYQVHPISVGDYLTLSYAFTRNLVNPSSLLIVGLYLVYLDGSGTEIASTLIDNLNSYSSSIGHPSNVISLYATQNCAAIGFKIKNTTTAGSTIEYVVDQFKIDQVFNTIVTTPPVGNNKVIGRYEDVEFQRIYKFVYNSNSNHTISYFDPNTSTTYEILRWSGLSFQSNYFVKAAKLDNWLAFTDRNNAPRLIDTDSIQSLFLQLGSTNFREFHISFHKWAPTVPPIPRNFFDTTTNVNNFEKLKNKLLQFSYRYIYFGNLKSRWSPISKGCITNICGSYYSTAPVGQPIQTQKITSIEVDIPGCIYDDPTSSAQYNYFDHTDLKFKVAVQYIELAFRESELDLWKQWKTVDVNNGYNRYQYFDGSATLTPLAQDDFNQPFDTVPFKAGTVEAVDNRFVFADILDEQPAATGLSVGNISIAKNGDWATSVNTEFPSLTPPQRADILRKNSLSNFNFKDRAIYKIGIQWLHKTGWRSAIYTTDQFIYNVDDNNVGSINAQVAFNFLLSVTPPDWAVGYQLFRTNALNIDAFIYGIANKFVPLVDDVSTILDQTTLPDNIKDRIRQHFENSRIIDGNDVIKQAEIEVNAAIQADKNKNKNRNNFLKLQENIGKGSGVLELYGTNRALNKYLRSNPIAVKLIPELRKTKAINVLADSSRIYIDINNWYSGSKKGLNKENPLNKLYYNYREGDRVRFVGSDVASPSNASQLKEYDVPIIEFTGKGIIIEKPATMLWMQAEGALGGFYYYNIEIYTQKTPDLADHLLYEVGEWYPVLYPGASNRALSKSDFVYTNNAAVTSVTYGPFNIFNKIPFFYADCYIVPKTVYRDTYAISPDVAQSTGNPSSGVNLSMSPDPDKTFDYWDKCDGRVSTTYQNLPISKFKTTLARFGGKIVEQSYVNNLNNFVDENQFLYPSEYGRIRNLINTSNAQVESVGSILLAIGEREAWSIYVNRTTLEDLSGNTQVGLSDQILGSYNTLLGSHGTLNPESVSKYRGNVYWWDQINGSWVRYGRDGLTPISDYKKRNWFKELGTLLMPYYFSGEIPVVMSEFDPFNMELVTFMSHSLLPATFRGYDDYKGDTFSENDKRWKHCHSYKPEMFAKMNNQLYYFDGGTIYQLEAGPDYNTFSGIKYDSMIEPVFNTDVTDVKHWRNIAYITTDRWSVERILSEYRGNKALQQSRIQLEAFELKEDTYWAAIKNDINTPNVLNPIVEGAPMRSKAIQVLMKLDPAVDYLSLFHFAFGLYDESPINT